MRETSMGQKAAEHGYHLYGDNTDKIYDQSQFLRHFTMLEKELAICVSPLIGDSDKLEFYAYASGDLCDVHLTTSGNKVVRVSHEACKLPDMQWWPEYADALRASISPNRGV